MFERTIYFIKQGIKNIIGHKVMSIASICIVTASLSLLGILVSAGLNISEFMSSIGDSREINVYISNDAGGRSIEEIESELSSIDGVKEVRFFSREDRLSKVTEEVYGDDGYVFEEGENPLRDSYILTVSDLTVSDSVEVKAEAVEGVEETIRNSDIIGGIDMLTKGVRTIGIWIILILFLIAVFIISNTIKLGMTSYGSEIHIMKIVGATNRFIVTPFVIEAFLLGFIGAAVASLITVSGYAFLVNRASLMISADIISFVSISKTAFAIVPAFFITGGGMGIVGSLFAVTRYLK